MPKAIRPSSTVKVRILLMLSGDRNAGDRGENDHLDHEQDERPELGPRDQPLAESEIGARQLPFAREPCRIL